MQLFRGKVLLHKSVKINDGSFSNIIIACEKSIDFQYPLKAEQEASVVQEVLMLN